MEEKHSIKESFMRLLLKVIRINSYMSKPYYYEPVKSTCTSHHTNGWNIYPKNMQPLCFVGVEWCYDLHEEIVPCIITTMQLLQ